MTEASRMQEILKVQAEAKRRCDAEERPEQGGLPKSGSYGAFLVTHALSLIALELNHLNTTLWRPRTEDK